MGQRGRVNGLLFFTIGPRKPAGWFFAATSRLPTDAFGAPPLTLGASNPAMKRTAGFSRGLPSNVPR
jgi:hypothetical protein